MDIFFSVLQTVLPVLLALVIGMLCREKKFLTEEGIQALKKVVVNITLPAVLVNAFATAQYDRASIIIPVAAFILCCIGLAVGFALAKLMRLGRLPAFLATGFEAGMLGYALFALLFPDESTSSFAIQDIGQTVFVFTVYKAMLSGKNEKNAIVRDIFTSPIIWAIIVGVLLGATGLYSASIRFSGTFDALTTFIAAPTGMIILLVVGHDLNLKKIQWRDTAALIALRLISMGILLGIVLLLNTYVLHGMFHMGAMLLTLLLPPPYVLPIFSTDEDQRARLSSALSALTLVTMVLFAVMAIVVQ